MCNNSNNVCGYLGNNWWWILILILLFCNCGGSCGNSCGNSGNWNNCGCDNSNCGCC